MTSETIMQIVIAVLMAWNTGLVAFMFWRKPK